ncbi:MAG TPA: type IV secretory system conjugative DNA transfer family protein, partial [Clostridia bacterium]|nr:type IV secretory system conjugative DNA transfer family protein [Clostridia bacterium]
LLIVDAKQDDTVSRVKELAARAGRSADVVVVGTKGDRFLDLLSPLQSLESVERMTSRMLSGTGSMGGDHNAYWDETRRALIDAALTMLVIGSRPVQFGDAIELMREWFFGVSDQGERLQPHIARIKNTLVQASLAEKRKLLQTLDTIALWRDLDVRTRSNVQSTLMLALRPLLGVAACRCFEPQNRPAIDLAEVSERGKICIVSVNATVDPDLARLLFSLVKADFFRAVQQRGDEKGPLCGVVADELPLMVSSEDVTSLATVRSRRCFVAAASQGFSALDDTLGTRRRQALLSNFGTIIFLRSREEEVDQFAATHLGSYNCLERGEVASDQGVLLGARPAWIRRPTLVCPRGTLGRLAQHQGFAALPGKQAHQHPLWFVPWYEESSIALEGTASDQAHELSSSKRLRSLMHSSGFRICCPPEIMSAAMELCSPRRDDLLAQATAFFRRKACLVPEGLSALPGCWLAALPHILWSLRRPHWTHLPFFIGRVAVSQGVLLLEFRQEQPTVEDRVTAWDRIRIATNASLYPSLWRPLARKHHIELRRRRPDLRPALELSGVAMG